ncbi:MAG: DsrE family protein [Xanthomonadales bacterium]|nr:DsrE family protein [Gammaproteobacteria bacterium]MBT8072354.1 DsrE family protein [Gammaproteobacteria bacterium]NNK03194.1 DsrE family protein [Xanthomonadales bacterium]
MFFRNGLIVLILLSPVSLLAAEARSGPIISNFGPVYEVPEGAWNLEKGKAYKVSMDVSATADFSGDLNRRIESAARFLNMHARNGIEMEDIDFAIVVHGSAGKDLLKDAAYEARFDEVNPNTPMLSDLAGAGVKVYLCGQTAAHRGLAAEDLHPAVTMALSAMTAHVRLQSEGYTLIPF